MVTVKCILLYLIQGSLMEDQEEVTISILVVYYVYIGSFNVSSYGSMSALTPQLPVAVEFAKSGKNGRGCTEGRG